VAPPERPPRDVLHLAHLPRRAEARRTPRQAFIAAFLLAFENLSFIHGRIGMLDVYMTTCILGGALLYLSEYFELAVWSSAWARCAKFNAVLASGAMFSTTAARPAAAPSPFLEGDKAAARDRAVLRCLLLAGARDAGRLLERIHGPLAHLSHMGEYHASLQHTGVPTAPRARRSSGG